MENEKVWSLQKLVGYDKHFQLTSETLACMPVEFFFSVLLLMVISIPSPNNNNYSQHQ